MGLRRARVDIDPKYRDKLEDILLGDHDTARRAKQSLHLSSVRMEKSNPDEARLLRTLSRRIRI